MNKRTIEIKQKICDTGALPFVIYFLSDGEIKKEISRVSLLYDEMNEIQHWIYDGILP